MPAPATNRGRAIPVHPPAPAGPAPRAPRRAHASRLARRAHPIPPALAAWGPAARACAPAPSRLALGCPASGLATLRRSNAPPARIPAPCGFLRPRSVGFAASRATGALPAHLQHACRARLGRWAARPAPALRPAIRWCARESPRTGPHPARRQRCGSRSPAPPGRCAACGRSAAPRRPVHRAQMQ